MQQPESLSDFSRDSSRVKDKEFDLLVIGGGINGAGVAWDAALRGLSVALLDKRDFGSGASFGCFKIVHGGLRYLQHLDFSRLRESVEEQRTLRLIAPHLVHPTPFLIPCTGSGMRSRWLMHLALKVYELITRGRNRGVDDYHHLPNHRILSAAETLSLAEGLPANEVKGGVQFYDCQISNCDRLTLSVVRAASEAGAECLNYSEVTDLQLETLDDETSRISKVLVKDLESNETFSLRANCVVNAAGPWLRPFLSRLLEADNEGQGRASVYSKGVQVVLPQFVSNTGVALESKAVDSAAVVSRGGRSFFVFPWRGLSLAGTTDSAVEAEPDSFGVSREELADFIQELKAYYSSDKISLENVKFVFGGFRPLDPALLDKFKRGKLSKGQATVSRDDLVMFHGDNEHSVGGKQIDNLWSVEGVKYTTFRALAERVVDQIVGRNEYRAHRRSRTRRVILPGGDVGNYARFRERQVALHGPVYGADYVAELVLNYGAETVDLIALMQSEQEMEQILCASPMLRRAEVAFACRVEMATHLDDLVFRRTNIGWFGHPGVAVLQSIARAMGSELAWDESREHKEVERVESFFSNLGVSHEN